MSLIIRRREGQGVNVSPDICIRVVEIRRRSVRLRITAPAEVPICRLELIDRDKNRRIDPALKRKSKNKFEFGNLSVTRKRGMSVVIDNAVTVTIGKITSARVELSIDASRSRLITRTETHNAGERNVTDDTTGKESKNVRV